MKTTILSLLAFTMLVNPAMAEPIEPASVRVIDGDTIAVGGRKPNIRLVGFNTPEIRNAKCEDEGRLGVNATNRLRELVQAEPLELTIVRCACKPGTEGTRNCNFGRSCGVLKSNGQDADSCDHQGYCNGQRHKENKGLSFYRILERCRIIDAGRSSQGKYCKFRLYDHANFSNCRCS